MCAANDCCARVPHARWQPTVYSLSLLATHSFYGLLLDNTKELRKALEDGNAVIDTINELRGAECEEASFTPPEAQPARLTGKCVCCLPRKRNQRI